MLGLWLGLTRHDWCGSLLNLLATLFGGLLLLSIVASGFTMMFAPEPAKEAAHMSKLIDRETRNEPDGAVAVPSGGDRADFIFLTKDQLGKRYPGVSLAGLPERGGAGLVIAADLAAAEKALGATGVRSSGGVVVPPAAGNGTLLAFVKA